MEKTYHIIGMTCMSCVAKIHDTISSLRDVKEVHVQLESPQLTMVSDTAIPRSTLQSALSAAGHYQLQAKIKQSQEADDLPDKSVQTYKPLILIVTFIAGVSLLAQFPFADFDGMEWMRLFMAGFFLVFAFFKLLNLQGFADSYQRYDIIAARWRPWAFIYPFVELTLGLLYLTNVMPFATNLTTALVLGISSVGVIKSNLDKRSIKCACLGDVFNLPMSTVTIVEDVTMVLMAGAMLFVS